MSESAPTRSSLYLNIVGLFLLAAVCVGLAFTPLRASHDEWWHLKTGQYIDEHGLPENEIFTYTAEKIPWHNHEWLSQVMLWRIWRAGEVAGFGGVRAVIAFKTLFVLATFGGLALFCWRWLGAPLASMAASALACGLSRRTLYPRPPFITYGFMAFVYALLLAWRGGRVRSRWLFCLPPLFALWANLHGGFMAGLIIGGAFWADAAFQWALARWRQEDSRPAMLRWLAITACGVACALATLATPYGIELYRLASRVMSDTRLAGIIFELRPPDWRYVWMVDAVLLATLLAGDRPVSRGSLATTILLGLLAIMLFRAGPVLFPSWSNVIAVRGREAFGLYLFARLCGRNPERLGLAVFLLLAFFMVQGFEHVRHLPLLAVVLAPALACGFAEWPRAAALDWRFGWMMHPAGLPTPEITAAREATFRRRIEFASLAVLAACAAFYQFFPGEAANIVSPPDGAERARFLGAPSGFSYNRALLAGQELQPGSYPVEAVDALLALSPPGRIWNGGNYAGYLIWRLSPERYKVFTDNRYDIYGGEFIDDELTVRDAQPGWRDVLKKWDARTLFVNTEDPIQRELETNGAGFRQAYRDRQFAIWIGE